MRCHIADPVGRIIQTVLLALALVGLAAPSIRAAEAVLPPLPPLNDPGTDAHLVGKFVWAGLDSGRRVRGRGLGIPAVDYGVPSHRHQRVGEIAVDP